MTPLLSKAGNIEAVLFPIFRKQAHTSMIADILGSKVDSMLETGTKMVWIGISYLIYLAVLVCFPVLWSYFI